MIDAPLILTVKLDADSFEYFNQLRQAHFPSERNFLEAHLTLFHALPGQEYAYIVEALDEYRKEQERITLEVTEVKMIGRGVAYKIESDRLQALHHHMRKRWEEWLSPQDRQKIWPHITVQNKVKPETARNLQQKLNMNFTPFQAHGIGLQLWAYRNGPWELLEEYLFTTF